jgi:hypothetical protein
MCLLLAVGHAAGAELPAGGVPASQPASLSFQQIASAVLNSSVPAAEAVNFAVSAGRVVRVKSSLALWQALQDDQGEMVNVVLQGKCALQLQAD